MSHDEDAVLREFVRRGRAAQAAVDRLTPGFTRSGTDLPVGDAHAAYALFRTMQTRDLRDLAAAHRLDLAGATSPETIVFCGGRIALIEAVLKTRGDDPVAR